MTSGMILLQSHILGEGPVHRIGFGGQESQHFVNVTGEMIRLTDPDSKDKNLKQGSRRPAVDIGKSEIAHALEEVGATRKAQEWSVGVWECARLGR